MSNLRQFKNSILENGGASYNLLTGEFNPDYGFMVSIADKESTSNYNNGDGLQYKIADFIKQHALILGSDISNEKYFLGAWVDNDLLYLDVSILHGTHEMAIKTARQNNQLAYFNNENKQTIYLSKK